MSDITKFNEGRPFEAKKATDYESIVERIDAPRIIEAGTADEEPVDTGGAAAKTEEPKRGFFLRHIGKWERKPPQWVVRDLFRKNSFGVVFGAPESGKSFFTLNAGLAVAKGMLFAGTFETDKDFEPGLVVYLAGEGYEGILLRCEAWGKFHNEDLSDEDGLPFFLSSMSADLTDARSIGDVVAEIDACIEQTGRPLRMLVVDTLNRNFGAGDENAAQDMKRFVDNLDAIRHQYTDATTLVVHHSGHADKSRAKGSIVLLGSTDDEFMVQKDGDILTIRNTKRKDGKKFLEGKPFTMKLHDIHLGEDEQGRPYGSAVLRMGGDEENAASERSVKFTQNEQLALHNFNEAAGIYGKVTDDGKFGGLDIEDWRMHFYAHSHYAAPCERDDEDEKKRKSNARRKGFDLAKKALLCKGALRNENNLIFPAGASAGVYEEIFLKSLKKVDEVNA